MFHYYTNAVSQASKSIAMGIFSLGLGLIGFGLLIYLLPKLFATVAAIIFFILGFGAVTTAIKIFFAQRHFDNISQDEAGDYRENVQVHIEDSQWQ
ncbi:MAG: hypothetical protein ACYST9_03860 [Planctomycetota bacterium]|jgi:hypothetical protein